MRSAGRFWRTANTLHYRQVFQDIFDELPLDQCREVVDILDMHAALKHSYSRLADPNMGIDPADVSSPGFDGSKETRYMGYAEFLVQTLGRWSEFKNADLNSHCPMLPEYRAMLQRWQASADRHKLTKEDVLRILAHPR